MKDNTKVVVWKEVVEEASSISSMPKKQIDDTADAIVKAVDKLLTDKQPKKHGGVLEVRTPFTNYVSTRLPETIVEDSSGNKVKRPEVCAVNCGTPTWAITAANVGLVDDVIEAETKKKSA